jgi:hypothetical protein
MCSHCLFPVVAKSLEQVVISPCAKLDDGNRLLISWTSLNKLKKYKESFKVSSEGPSSGVNSRRRAFARNVEILLIFFRYLHPYQRKLVHLIGTTYTGKDSLLLYVVPTRLIGKDSSFSNKTNTGCSQQAVTSLLSSTCWQLVTRYQTC